MPMYIVNIAVRWANGELEGFGSSGLTEEVARKRAIDKAHSKASSFPGNTGFDVLSKAQYDKLTIDEQDDLQYDWDNSSL